MKKIKNEYLIVISDGFKIKGRDFEIYRRRDVLTQRHRDVETQRHRERRDAMHCVSTVKHLFAKSKR